MATQSEDKKLTDAQKFAIREYIDNLDGQKEERRTRFVREWSAIVGVTGVALLGSAWAFIQNQAVTEASRDATVIAKEYSQQAIDYVKKELADKAGDIEAKRKEAYDAIIRSRVTTEAMETQTAESLRRSGELRKKLEESLALFEQTDSKSKQASETLKLAGDKVGLLDTQVNENLQRSDLLKSQVNENLRQSEQLSVSLSKSRAVTEEVGRQVDEIKKIYIAVNSLNSAKLDIVDAIKSDSNLLNRLAGNIVVPAGLIAAFDRSQSVGACPAGWRLFEQTKGRIIIGAGANTNKDVNGYDLTDYPALRDDASKAVGGEEKHKLTVAEMPSHDHANGSFNQLMKLSGGWTAKFGDDGVNEPTLNVSKPELKSGGDQPHNIMPPFVALYYCIKE